MQKDTSINWPNFLVVRASFWYIVNGKGVTVVLTSYWWELLGDSDRTEGDGDTPILVLAACRIAYVMAVGLRVVTAGFFWYYVKVSMKHGEDRVVVMRGGIDRVDYSRFAVIDEDEAGRMAIWWRWWQQKENPEKISVFQEFILWPKTSFVFICFLCKRGHGRGAPQLLLNQHCKYRSCCISHELGIFRPATESISPSSSFPF